MNKQIQHTSPDAADGTSPLLEAFEATRAERAALAESEVVFANVDLTRAATIALGAYPAIEALFAEIARALPDCDLALFRTIPAKADAVLQADGDFLAASTPDPELPGLNQEADALRHVMRIDLERAASHGVIAADRMKELSGATGYRNVASDLVVLTTIARTDAEALRGKTGITDAELERATKIAARMWHAIAERDASPERVDMANAERRRAFLLLDRAYDAARRAVSFVRWAEGDASEIAPSLRSQRARSNAKAAPVKRSANS